MLELSNEALALLIDGKFEEAGKLAIRSVKEMPNHYHPHYAVGQYFKAVGDFAQACTALDRAHQLGRGEKHVLLALAISRQMKGDFSDSINAIKSALEIDPEYVLAYNTLGMTQKLKGDHEKASNTYHFAAEVLARLNSKAMENSPNSERIMHGDSRNSLWSEYAATGALYLTALNPKLEGMSWPTGKMAERDARSQEFQGLYWQDVCTVDGKELRQFLPNYFNTFRERLKQNGTYANLMGNRSTVLRLLGRESEADQHLEEAQDFSQ